MKIYIKSSLKDKYRNILDNLVDGNKIWNPCTGEFDTLSDERLEELRNPKPDLLKGLEPTTYYIFKNGKLGWRAIAGDQFDNQRPYRNAGRYKIYLNSFGGAQLPQSRLLVADTQTGVVYERTVHHGTSDFRRDIAELVEWLSEGNEITQ